MKTPKRQIGDTGEEVACKYLEARGFKVLERNYLRKWGEIDIIAEKAKRLYFVEVKSVSRELLGPNRAGGLGVTRPSADAITKGIPYPRYRLGRPREKLSIWNSPDYTGADPQFAVLFASGFDSFE